MARRKTPEGDDAAELWRAVTRDVAPLKGRRPAPPAPEPEPPSRAEKKKPARKAPPARPAPQAPPPAPPPPLPDLAHGRAPGLDKRSAQRLTRGRMKIDATLDLHGMTQAQAVQALNGFLADSQDRGRRCVLVITGKGRVGDDTGVLRSMVPRWLNAPPNRARVLGFDLAQPKHGGHGALYVLLRRVR
ncbi:MAG: Smr/MutS family protein [Alphaproteobacteria bacterium]